MKTEHLPDPEEFRRVDRRRQQASHIVRFFDDDAFLERSVASYLGTALGSGAKALAIASEPRLAGIERGLREQGIDIRTSRDSGHLRFLNADETLSRFVRDGVVDADLFQGILAEILPAGSADATRVHLFGEMVSLLALQGNGEAALKLERIWNAVADGTDMSLYCAYPIRAFSKRTAKELFDLICNEHTLVIPAESFQGVGATDESQLRSIAALQQKAAALESEVAERIRMESALSEQSRTLHILQRTCSTLAAEQELEKVVQLVTDAGCELSGADHGAFYLRVSGSSGDSYVLSAVSGSPAEPFEPVLRRESFLMGDARNESTPLESRSARGLLDVPVDGKGGETLGCIRLAHTDAHSFTPKSTQWMVALAAQTAVAIENAKLHETLRRELRALKKAEAASRQLAAIVESSEDAIVSKTLDGIIATWNQGAERMFGYTAAEAIGNPITILYPEDHLDEAPGILERIRRGDRVEHYETRRRRKDGTLVDISLTVSALRDGRGEIVGASKIARDISQRKRDEKALELANAELAKAKDELESRVEERTASLREAIAQLEEFSYTVSHDLRAPLRAMSNHCSILENDFQGVLGLAPEAKWSVERIKESCLKLDKMIREVLAYGRIARDNVALEPVSLEKLVRETIASYSDLQPPNAEVTIGDLGTVLAHEPSLTQVLSNLLNNAVKFVAPGVPPKVSVWSEEREGLTRLWLVDNGIGIEPRYHSRLFSMFERIHPELPYEGTGVGLAIVRKATERMGGRVGVESDGVNGSRFWVDLQTA